MTEDNPARPRSTEPAEGGAGTPLPEKGSPTSADGGPGKANEDAEHNDRSEGDPPAPPVNTQAGS